MCLSLNQAIYQQLASLVQGMVNKKGVKNLKTEILTIVNTLGAEGEKHLFLCLLDGLDFKDSKVQNGSKDQQKTQFLTQRLTLCSSQGIFLDYFSQVVEQVCPNQKYAEYLNDMSKCLKLSVPLQLLLGVSLALSHNPTLNKEGIALLKMKLAEYYQLGKPMSFPENTLSALLYIVRVSREFADLSAEVQYLLETNQSAEKIAEFKPLFVKDSGSANEGRPDIGTVHVSSIKLWELLADIGPTITWNTQELSLLMMEYPTLDEDSIFQALLMMSNTVGDDFNDTRVYAQTYTAAKTNDWTAFQEGHSEKKVQTNWNFDNFIRCCMEHSSNLKWPNVIKKLDRPDLKFVDQRAFQTFFSVLRKCKSYSNYSFPPSVLFEHWNNSTSQITFLINVFNCGQPDLVFFNECPKRQVALDLYPNLKISNLNPAVLQFWSSLDFLEILVELSDSDYFVEIRNLFDFPLSKCPDMLILGLAQIKPKRGATLLDELYSYLFPLYLLNHASSLEIIEAIWKINPSIMISAIAELYKKDNSSLNLSRVLDITQEIKDSLIPIASCKDYNFAVSLGILAAKRDFLHLDQWLAERIKTAGNQFVAAIFKYIDDNIIEPCNVNNDTQYDTILDRSQLSYETLSLIFQLLMNPNYESKLSPKNRVLLSEKYKEICRLYPAIVAESSRTEIEESANTIFYKLYKEEMSIPELIDLMTRYKNSSSNKEKEIFACMMTNLFDEYRFFSRYPERELFITAQVYGSVLANRLIEGVTQNIGLKCIFEALKKTGKLFDFGVRALEYCKGRLHEWQPNTSLLFQNEQLKRKHLDLLEEIRNMCLAKGVQLDIPPEYYRYLQERPQESNGNLAGPSTKRGQQQQPQQVLPENIDQFGGLNLGSQFTSQQAQLLQNLQNQIGFNQPMNTNVTNESPKKPVPMQQKMPQTSSDPFMVGGGGMPFGSADPSFGNFGQMNPLLVGSSQQSGGQLRMNSNPITVTQPATKMTLPTKATSGPDQTKAQPSKGPKKEGDSSQPSSESLTMAADRELPEISEDIKNKVTFALNNCTPTNIDEKIGEIRFYIEHNNVPTWIAKYVVYKRAPYEPNLHGVYITIVTKLNKREMFPMMIKDTYKCINIVLGSERLANEKPILRNLGQWLGGLTLARDKPIIISDFDLKNLLLDSLENNKLEYVLPMVCKILSMSTQSQVFNINNAWMRSLLQLLLEICERPELKMHQKAEVTVLFTELKIESKSIPPSDLISRRLQRKKRPTTKTMVIDLVEHVQIDKSLAIYQDIDLKNIVAQVLEKAISDLIPHLVTRSVAIALITAKELVLKDFALEPSDVKLLQGTNLIVQHLAGSLALVTCREPLRLSLINYLKQALEGYNIEESAKEEMINLLSSDNLNLGCSLIKKAVVEKAIEDVNREPAIIEAVERRQEAMRHGTSFNTDDNLFHIIANLPEVLRPSPRGLTPDQFKIYEDFAGSSRAQINQNSGNKKPTNPTSVEAERTKVGERKLDQRSLQVVAEFEQYIKQLDKVLGTWSSSQSDPLTKDERLREFHSLTKRISDLIKKTENMNVLAYEFAIKIMIQAFGGKLSTEKMTVYLDLLTTLKRYYDSNLSVEVLEWILDPQEKRTLKYDIILILIRKNFITIPEFDEMYADALEKYNQAYQFVPVAKIIQTLVFDEKLLPLENFQRSVDQILKNRKQLEGVPEMTKFFEELDAEKQRAASDPNSQKFKGSSQHQQQPAAFGAVLSLFSEKEAEFFKTCAQKLYQWLPIADEKEIFEYMGSISDILQSQDDNASKFFVFITDLCVDHTLESTKRAELYSSVLGLDLQDMDFTYIDALSKLIIVLLKTITTNKVELFDKFLSSATLVLIKYHDFQREKFNQRPFFKLFLNLIYDLKRKEYNFSTADTIQFLSTLIKLFDRIQPLKCPSFAFAWLQLISHKDFMPLVLMTGAQTAQLKGDMWGRFSSLLISIFKMLKEVSETEYFKSDSMKTFYKGVLRMLLVILNDFPEFFIEMSFFLCEFIPEKFIQIRNLILSAFPPNMVLPEPSRAAPLQQLEAKEEFRTLPVTLGNFSERITSIDLHTSILSYLNTPQNNDTFFREICSKLVIQSDSAKGSINYPVVNAFVLYIPSCVLRAQEPKAKEYRRESYNLFMKLITFSNSNMRETLLNAILNNIRYPNLITFYFISLLFSFYMFDEYGVIQEQIFRMLDMRISIENPHPWGIAYAHANILKIPKMKERFYPQATNTGGMWNQSQ